MRVPRSAWLLIPLLLICTYFLQHNPHSTRAQAGVPPAIPVIGGPTAGPQITFSGLWRVDGNFQSAIHIKNSLVVGPVQVTPALYMADGTEYDLPPVIVPTAGTSVVSVNRALAQAPPGVQAHLSSYGSAALRYRGIPMSVAGVIDMLDAPRSLLFSASFMMPMMTHGMKDATQTLEGLWWRRNPGVGGFVSFANTTGKTVSVTFQVIGSEGTALPPESLSLPAHNTQMFDLDRLTLGLAGLENQAGGVRVQWQGSAADLAVTGGLEDAREGFSSNMQFWSHNLRAAPAPSTMAAVGLMTGEPDPSLGYPSGTRFTPYAVLRNSTSSPLSVRLVVHETSGTGSFSLPLRVLKPLETVRVEITNALADAGQGDMGGTLNLVLSYTGRPGDLVVDTVSVDHTGNYTMPAPVQLLDETLSLESPFWTVAGDWDTMYMLWNWTDKAEDVVVTFYYSDGSGHFKLPVHLEARGSATIDMAKVIAAGQPDAEGNVIPAGVRRGSAVFAGPKGVTSPIHLAVCGMHFSAQLGVSEACCIDCLGYCGLFITPSPIDSVTGQSMQLMAQSYYSDGTLHDFTGSSNWSSSNTSIATVETTGQTAPGLCSAVAVGSCTITASRSLTAQGVHLVGCGACPGVQVMTGQATATVQQPVPTNFTQVGPGTDKGGGVLEFQYSWKSSTGKLSDLSSCVVYEVVNYPGTSTPYVWPKPPWNTSTYNPTSTGVAGTAGAAIDDQLPGTWLKPYQVASFTATQYYKYTCNGGSELTLSGPLSIARSVTKNTNGTFAYTVTKSGASAVLNPIP